MFSQILSVAATIILSLSFVQAQIAPGRYRIWNGAQSARSFPGGGHQGPFKVPITMSNQFASIWEQFDVVQQGDKYIIKSAGTGARSVAVPSLNEQVFAASNDQTLWFIENKGVNPGQDLYNIKVPYQDLLWTNVPGSSGDGAIFLQGSDGGADQRFVFQLVPPS